MPKQNMCLGYIIYQLLCGKNNPPLSLDLECHSYYKYFGTKLEYCCPDMS